MRMRGKMENKANKENMPSDSYNPLREISHGRKCQTVSNFASLSGGKKKKSCVMKEKKVQQRITYKLRSPLQAKKKKKKCASQVQAERVPCQEPETDEQHNHNQKSNNLFAFKEKEKKANKPGYERNTICVEKKASKILYEKGGNTVSDGQKSVSTFCEEEDTPPTGERTPEREKSKAALKKKKKKAHAGNKKNKGEKYEDIVSKLWECKNVSLINFLKKIKREKFQSTAQILNEKYLERRKKKRDQRGCKKEGANYWEQQGSKSCDIGGNRNQTPAVKIQRMNIPNNDCPLEGSQPAIEKSKNINERHKSCQERNNPSNVLQMEGGNSNTFYDTQGDKYYVKINSNECTQNVDIDQDFFYDRSRHKGREMSKEEVQCNHSSISIKVKKFFLIFCNGCLVVFLGVSNNICGRMRNRVLNNFDSLTASYNAIAYVMIYLVLCIIYCKSRSITKEHWSYIYPCLRRYFRKREKGSDVRQIEKEKGEPKQESDWTIDMRDQETIKRKKKIMKLFYIHKKRIYEPLLEKGKDDVEVGSSGAISSSISGSIDNSRCSSRCCNRKGGHIDIPSEQPSVGLCGGRSISKSEGASARAKPSQVKDARAGQDNTLHSGSALNICEPSSHEMKEYNDEKTNTLCPCRNAIVENSDAEEVYSFSKQDIKDILEHHQHDKSYKDALRCRETTENGLFSNVKKKWRNLGAYKYIVVIALLDIISNTLYFVSQLAIPLTILLLLNQLNFIFSIILSYFILRRKYNIHHALSVIIVIVGFLFFYIPYVYKEDTVITKQTMVSYYMNSNFYLNVNDALNSSSSYFNRFYPCNEPSSSTTSPFGIFASILFCVLSILLTSYGGILREIFFSEYIKGREKRHKVISLRKGKTKCSQYCSAICAPELGVPQNVFCEIDTEGRTSSGESNKQERKHDHSEKETLVEYPLFNKPTNIYKNGYMVNVKQSTVSFQQGDDELLSGVSVSQANRIMDGVDSAEGHFTSPCPMCGKGGAQADASKGGLDIMENKPLHNIVEVEKVTPKCERVQKRKKGRSGSDKMSVILLSFNISLIQICLLPMIIYFQLLFNNDKDVSYLLYIKDSIQCFSGQTMENNSNCKYSFGVYSLYIVVNAIFNLSVSSFYSNYSSAECFLILKSSTPLTLVVLYFYDFPFILESDKYFSIYFLISIVIVFTGVSYFFYQSVASDKKKKKKKKKVAT
ncbi:conserved Plasmodium protein, unknown function [Plasmodium knowlesi strain H]|uniref:Transporter n=3 Tax=Plasmodium knowlesi TaxID=5850 RepID=B3L5D2_PLAKH|nr:conserved Plasmodium protein, unknown function [Plasmodium knowlesi strain H]OTN65172.1 Uncharacterized protein PKNOH_S120149300 [Plasmodium knowlesi]CAA9988350.1 conserved Plasmodium protein, unknown function [Plasmodium knowlesi strain H]SBO20077.1 conserved Plasmodium protein, unknown function [Plasmodium knowlesi strain H]VVS77824.1 conserved Plasmodium protein, unknown function [Plasmodium knowlesi strain H]|eukprot:XP_002259330.1 hypothetical protein, conserved in Plasmodium species [Plasmodium knowlesi strain H]